MSSKNKGNVAEREVADLLQKWWCQLEPSIRMCRTPASGGWQGKDIRAAFKASGDIMTTAQYWPFCVEVKRREGWSLTMLLAGKTSPVWQWWIQAQIAAKELSAVPMLWIRKNRQPWQVMLPSSYSTPQRSIWMPWPVVAWTAEQLLSINYGSELPCLYNASEILSVDPKHF